MRYLIFQIRVMCVEGKWKTTARTLIRRSVIAAATACYCNQCVYYIHVVMLAHLYSFVHCRSSLAYTGNRWVIMNCQNIDHRVQASPWNEETSDCKCECWWEHENNQICSLLFFHNCFSHNYDISGVCCCRCLTGRCATKHTNTVRTKTLNTTKVGGLILIQLSQLNILNQKWEKL